MNGTPMHSTNGNKPAMAKPIVTTTARNDATKKNLLATIRYAVNEIEVSAANLLTAQDAENLLGRIELMRTRVLALQRLTAPPASPLRAPDEVSWKVGVSPDEF